MGRLPGRLFPQDRKGRPRGPIRKASYLQISLAFCRFLLRGVLVPPRSEGLSETRLLACSRRTTDSLAAVRERTRGVRGLKIAIRGQRRQALEKWRLC